MRDFLKRFTRNKAAVFGAAVILLLVVLALLAPVLRPYDPVKDVNYLQKLKPPSIHHPFGTDDLGHDLLAAMLHGARTSLRAGSISVLIAIAIGLPVGLIAGYYRGWVDEWIISRITDAMQAFPFLILALAVTAILGTGLTKAMVAIGIGFTPGFIRVVRAAVLSEREKDYVQAARAMGGQDARIIVRHVLPNALAPILVQGTLALAAAIIAESSLSFLGLGAQPPTPDWGNMLKVATTYLTVDAWFAFWPGLAIFLCVLGFNLLGDGLRDALDPRLK